MSGYTRQQSALMRWFEALVLRVLYGIVRGLIGLRDGAASLRRRMLVFTTLVLSGIALVMVAAIPVSYYLLGEDMTAVAAVEESHNKGQIEGRTAVPSEAKEEALDDTALEHAGKHQDANYVCPMHPEIISKDPNDTCPICGMNLVLVEAGSEGGAVNISPVVMNALGVRTARADKKTIFRSIDTVGYVSEDENKIRTISLRTEGWIERLVVKAVGDPVKRGQLLAEIYSPVLVNVQEEFVHALQLGGPGLIEASKERMAALGISRQQIERIAETREPEQRVAVYAPQDGIVSELPMREGMNVPPSKPLISLVDLSSVWLLVDVFEGQADWVKVGQRARAELPFLPNKRWDGTVDYVYPQVDPKTRSVKARLRFENKDGALKPNMYADVRIFAQPRKNALAIPREAVIRTGDEQRVIVALGEGKFIPMPVRVGVETDDYVEVLSGLNEGDQVVVSSQFMIDSEASVKAALMKMTH